MFYRIEARTGTGYYLYLPRDYLETEGTRSPDKKWPTVITFHGMRPFDSAGAQCLEWQQEADRYGYVVVAPTTRVSDLLGEIPLRRVNYSLKHDEKSTLAILDELYELLDVDPNHSLSTSWSMGGYLAHYMINRHPHRISCLAVKQSTFSADILDSSNIPEYRDHKIGIFYTQNDLGNCRSESKQAIAWYTHHGFDTTSGVIDHRGHERMPELAAAFFAKTCDAVPKTPPTQLAGVTMARSPAVPHKSSPKTRLRTMANARKAKPGNNKPPNRNLGKSSKINKPAQSREDLTVASSGKRSRSTKQPGHRDRGKSLQKPQTSQKKKTSIPKPSPSMKRDGKTLSIKPIPSKAVTPLKKQDSLKPKRRRETKSSSQNISPLKVRLSATIGISPMLLSYTVHIPPEMLKDADVLWLDNGEPISHGISGQKSLSKSGQHKIEVLVVTKDNQEYRTHKKVTVLERLLLNEDGK